jgi:phosphoribosylaminoimidazolecarboxamide formyltransferase/IMP cyclohydrolase
MMDGRVKTLHPKVHGGFLARRDLESHLEAARQHDIKLFDLVVINLYPFEAVTAKAGTTFEEAVENIDIGGPAMVRSAAKNAASVTRSSLHPSNMQSDVAAELVTHNGATTLALREKLRLAAYRRTAAYDAAISAYLEVKSGVKGLRLSLVEKQGPAIRRKSSPECCLSGRSRQRSAVEATCRQRTFIQQYSRSRHRDQARG